MKTIFAMCFFVTTVWAQDVPTPAPKQSRPILIKNARIHIGDGRVIEKGDVLFDQGKILEVGSVTTRPQNVLEVDAAGKEIYPGLIAGNTSLGLTEVEAARATLDLEEVGPINPNARTLIAYNTDSRIMPTVRWNGVLIAQVTPNGTLMAGSSSIVQLDAWNWEDAAIKRDDGLWIVWPNMVINTAWWAAPADVQKKNSETALKNLAKAMDDAKAYAAAKEAGSVVTIDQRWESMIPVFKKAKTVFIYANNVKAIEAAVAFSKRYDVKTVVVGGSDAWLVPNLLKENNIPVMISGLHVLPAKDDDDTDIRYKLPKLLKDAGVKFCIAMEGSWQERNLPFQAGTAAGFGLTKEEALSAITKDAAEILGIGDRLGTLEKGKVATLIVSKGDVLDMRSSVIEAAYIDGRKIDLGNRHVDLYNKFKAKYQGQ